MATGHGDLASEAQFIVLRGVHEGMVKELSGDEVRVGRMPDNEFVLNSAKVSRYHAKLLRTPDGWAIEDLGSRNGVLHNGYRISAGAAVPLRNRDTVELSDVTMLYLAGSLNQARQRAISTIVVDMKKAEAEGDAAVSQFLKGLRDPV